MPENQIRWKKGDYITLGKAVSNFNKKIRELQTEENNLYLPEEENKLYLPEEVNYRDLKNKITTRRRLNQIVNSLKRFQEDGAEKIVENSAGQKMTSWENNENQILKRIAIRRLNSELKALEIPGTSGFSRKEMGSVEANQILASIRSIKKLEEKAGYEFNRIKIRLQDLGSSDFKMIKSIIFKENFMGAVESYSNLDGYDLLIKKLNRMKNPINFYNLIKKSDVFSDIFLYYKPR